MSNFYEDLAGEVGSDVESDVSDVNPAEMAKMLQDLDDMDSALFKSKKQNESTVASIKSTKKGVETRELSAKTEKPHISSNNTSKVDELEKKAQVKKQDNEFDWDDPLADILSSDESVTKPVHSSGVKTKKSKKVTISEESEMKGAMKSKTQKGKLIADLFGLDDNSKNEKDKEVVLNKKNEESKSLDAFPDKPISTERTNILNSQTNVDEVPLKKNPVGVGSKSLISKRKDDPIEGDDHLMGLSLETDQKKTHNLFGSSTSSKKSIIEDIFTAEPNRNILETKRNTGKEEVHEESVSFGSYAPSLTGNRESRRAASRRDTSSIGDPLGLFTPPTTPSKKQAAASSQKQVSDLKTSTPLKKQVLDDDKADWLGLSTSKDEGTYSSLSPERKRQTTVIENKPSRKSLTESNQQSSLPQQDPDELPEWLGGKSTTKIKREEARKDQAPAKPSDLTNTNPTLSPTLQEAHLLAEQGLTLQANAQMEQEAAYALQLQEQQLRTAVHLRQHEMQMASIHERQRALLQQQERQMQQLLAQQAQRQQQLEQQLQIQQKRIADYMQALIAQPAVVMPTLTPELGLQTDSAAIPMSSPSPGQEQQITKENKNENAVADNIDSGPTNKGIKIQLTELQVSLQQCELEKKALESTMENLQSKHKEEIQLMEDCYKRQIAILEEAMEKHSLRLRAENERLESDYIDRLSKLQEQQVLLVENHAQQLAALQKDHVTDMQALKSQHDELLKHVRHIQHSETNAVKEASENINVLQSTVEQLGKNTDSLTEMQLWLEKQSGSQNELRELSLKAKEAEILAYKENLLKQREAAEEERRKLLGLVEQLELQIVEQRSKAEEEKFSLRQDTARLDARIASFEREKEYAKAEIEKERQHVETARQLLLQEQKAVTLQFKEEKISLAQERSRIQALTQLHGAAVASQEQVMQLKAEAEAALAVAKEATEQVDVQRAAILEQQKKIDQERLRLQAMEHNLTVKARELEALSQTALATRNEGVEALANAAQSEQCQKQRAADLQRQLNEIRQREQRLSEERATLSQERMKLHKSRDQKICSSCKNPLKRPNQSEEPSLITGSEASKYVDPKLVILKLVAEKERDALLSTSLNLSVPK